MRVLRIASIWLFILVSFSACSSSSTASPVVLSTQTPKPIFTSTPVPVATATTQPSLWLPDYLPEDLKKSIVLPVGWQLADSSSSATTRLDVGGEAPVSRWIYALVAPFPTLRTRVTMDELRSAWSGAPPVDFSGPLMMDENTLAIFSLLWGTPVNNAVQVVPSQGLIDIAWTVPHSWAIIPFEEIQPRWKVLIVDGQSPLHNDFDASNYGLAVPFSFSGDRLEVRATNRDSQKLTVVAMTGVTALVRGTALLMELKGVLYPDGDVRDILRSADITHISNEITFTPKCPTIDMVTKSLVFCSSPKYIELLDDVGTDVVELTGDHLGDYGPDAMNYTLDLYDQRGWPYFGGGRNLKEALSPAKFTHNGNKIAFIGCNAKGGGYATASETHPGAGACGYDELHQAISQLNADGYIVIVTFSHQEYYTYQVLPQYRPDFTGMIDAGATVVQGSQAHQPQNFEFYQQGFIHYGLGNMFFDQIGEHTNDGLPVDSAFIDLHVVYDGRYICTELIPIKFIDYARPRPMTMDEANVFLEKIFKASGWLGGNPFPVLTP